jgi:uncharacterized protein (TIGR03437 family)
MRGAMSLSLAVVFLSQSTVALAQQKYTISTIAGTGTGNYSGDSASATSAELNSPFGITVAKDGSLIIADQINHRIRKITSGTITTIVGKGTAGLSSDETTTPTDASLTFPTSVFYDSAGNLYIADTHNNVIRKLATDGKITRLAGTGVSGYNSADDYDPAGDADNDDTINSADSDYNAVLPEDISMSNPIGVAVTSTGIIYIADTKNHRIRKVDGDKHVTTVAGTGTAGWSEEGIEGIEADLNTPMGLTLDAAGNLYIADTMNHRVRMLAADGKITTVAGRGTAGFSGDGGQATAARLFYPKSIQIGPDGKLYIADTFNSRIRVVAADGTISTIAGNGRFSWGGDGGDSLRAELRFPNAVAAASDGRVYISDSQNNRIRLLTPVSPDPTEAERPIISLNGISTPADFGSSKVFSPGAWMEIRGQRLAASERAWQNEDFIAGIAPTVLDGTRVKIDGVDAHVAFVSPETVRVLLPNGIQPGRREVVVESALGHSDAYKVTFEESHPAVNAPARFQVGGAQYASAVFEDGATYALPEASVEGAATRPAKPGETLTFYGIGFGEVTPGITIGQLVDVENTLVRRLEVLFGETPAEVRYAGLAKGAVGMYQLSVVVPEGVEGDAVPVTVKLDGESSKQQINIAARQ